MSARLIVSAEAGPLERLACELAAVPLFADERPLRGSAGRADWRLCGRLSQLLGDDRLRGERWRAALVESTGGLGAPLLLVVGCGPRRGFDADSLEEFTRNVVGRAVALQRGGVAVAFEGAGEMEEELRARRLVAGAADALDCLPPEKVGVFRLRVALAPEDLGRGAELLGAAWPERLPEAVTLELPGPRRHRTELLARAASPVK